MKIELNNPLPILSAKLLGVGIEITVEREDEITQFCIKVEAIVWTKCWVI
jgi:hypothetical protein